jgi:hypothetical protein
MNSNSPAPNHKRGSLQEKRRAEIGFGVSKTIQNRKIFFIYMEK